MESAHTLGYLVTIVTIVSLSVVYSDGALPCTSNDACHCKGEGFSISWKNKFQYPVNISYTNQKGDSYTFSFSPCADVSCGGEQNVAVCQYDPTANKGEGGFTSIGSRDQAEWDVTSATEFTVVYSGGTQTWDKKERRAIISVNGTSDGKSTLVSTGDNDLEKEIDYNFKAKIRSGGGGGGGGGLPVWIIAVICGLVAILLLTALSTFILVVITAVILCRKLHSHPQEIKYTKVSKSIN